MGGKLVKLCLRAALVGCLPVVISSCDGLTERSLTGPELDAGVEGSMNLSGPGIVGVTDIQVASGRSYVAVPGGMSNGARVYVDRNYTYDDVPASVQGLTYIRTGNGDQNSTGSNFLSFTIDRPAIVYVAYSGTSLPAWLANNFEPTGESLIVAKSAQRMTFQLYAATFSPGVVSLGGNGESGPSEGMYTVMLEEAESSTARVADIQVASGRPYRAEEGGMGNGATPYIDRNYTYEEVPSLVAGETFIQTASGDQNSAAASNFLSFTVDRESVVYVAYHGTNPPAWITSSYEPTGETLVVAKSVQRMTFHIYARTVAPGRVTLGGNIEPGGSAAMYTVIVKGVGEPTANTRAFTQVEAGYYHTCALDEDGRAYCWGYNTNRGQVGDGTTADRPLPVAVAGGLTFRSLSGGGYHTCGITTGNAAYCWGKNNYGQLGNGTTVDALQPVQVLGGQSFTDIATGDSHTCAMLTDGRAACWGLNASGQLGNGSTSHSAIPTLVQGGNVFIDVEVGYDHSCGLLAGGSARCWGKNTHGQLGDGTRTNRTTPVLVAGGLNFATTGTAAGVKAGQNHTCAVTTSGQVYCWGDNWHNMVGVGNTRGVVVTPQPVPGVPTAVSIGLGGDHSCALTSTGQAYCWGDNLRGQLGGGIESEYNAPVQVEGGLQFTGLSMGWDHTCGTTASGQTYCWGYNNKGQLGDGTRTLRREAVAVFQPSM